MTTIKDTVQRTLRRYVDVFRAFTPGQKVTAVLGTIGLVFGAVLLYSWVSAPQYAPLFTNLSAKDASAVVSKLDAQGTKYQITGGGGTILVPQDEVYKDRIALSGDGLPSGSDGGYSLLDNQSLSTSDFQQQVTYKRAMEGELSKTLSAMDGVNSAVVHLALPSKQVFSDNQDPTTASVLLDVKPGVTLDDSQVQAVVHLVASSIDGLDPSKVTVADQAGNLLSVPSDGTGSSIAATTRDKQTAAFEAAQTQRIQAILDRVVGPGNGTVQVTADLNYDQATQSSTTYKQAAPNGLATSQTTTSEDYKGAGAGGAAGAAGVVGPDGQLQTGSTSATGTGTPSDQSTYSKKSSTSDQALDTTTTNTVIAPGAVNSLHVGIVLDQKKVGSVDTNALQQSIASAIGYDAKRGDTLNVSQLPFDRSAEQAAAAELAAQSAADQQAQLTGYLKTGIPAVLLLLLLVVGWLRARKRAKAREEATEYVVGQLREEAAIRASMAHDLADAAPAAAAATEDEALRRELAELVEQQPEDVAALLRGWLVERPS